MDLVGPKGYIHGWIKVGQTPQRLPTGGNAGRLSLIGPEPSRGSLGAKWKPVDITTGAGMPLEPQATYERRMARQQAKEAERASRGLPRHGDPAAAVRQHAVDTYNQMRQAGHPHHRALAVARKILGAIGEGLGAGSAVPPASKGKLSASWKPSKAEMKADRQFEPSFLTHPSKKQAQGFASMFSWGEVLEAIELVGPKGYTHGWHYVGGPGLGPPTGPPYQPTRNALTELNPAGGWQQYANDNSSYHLELSAQTARLAVTPAPRGRPGGPGLYDVKGMGHSPYLQNIVKALISKRGMEPGKAYAIARSAIRKWGRGGGHVHPEVRTAATAAESEEVAKQARARASHGHANTPWGAVELASELFNPAGNPSQARTPQGQAGGGQFTAGGGGQQSQQKGKTPAKAPAKPGGGGGANAQAKASLRTTIAQQMAQLNGMRGILQQMMAGKITPSAASSAVSKLSKGSTPAAKGAAATSAKAVATAKAGAAATAAASTTASKTATATAKKTVLTKQTEAKAITSKISALAKQIAANRAALAKL